MAEAPETIEVEVPNYVWCVKLGGITHESDLCDGTHYPVKVEVPVNYTNEE